MMTFEVFGYVAMVMIPVSLLPQVIKSWRTRSTRDISLTWTSIYTAGLVCWLVYGIGIGSVPLIISPIIEGSFALSLLVLKIMHG
jgi:MtN3 and saliva related transmembrane protein